MSDWVRWNGLHTLDEDDELTISIAGREVVRLNIERGTVSKHWSDETPIEQDRQHAGGVVAFCRLAHREPILVRDEWINGEGKIHCYLADGRSVSVKQTPYERGQLLVEEDEPRVPDIYVLMVGVSPTYVFRGWETRERIFLPENLTWGYRSKAQRPSQRYHLRQQLFANAGNPIGFLQRDLELPE